MRKLNRRNKVILAVSAGAAVLVNAGAALAYWSLSAQGSGDATAATIQSLVVSADLDPTTSLYPGASGDLRLSITNHNSFPVVVNGLAKQNVPITVDAAHGAKGCTPAMVSLTDTLFSGYWPVPAGQTAVFPIESALTMESAAPPGCGGATFTIPIKVVGVTSH